MTEKHLTCHYGKQARRGFTLIELLLVLVILVALTAIVAPKFTNRSRQARIDATKASIAGIELAIDTYEIDNGLYPSTSEGLKALLEKPASATNWQGPYLKKGLPKDPWGNAFVYIAPGKNNTSGYDLYSLGPDGNEGGNDDIVNWSEE